LHVEALEDRSVPALITDPVGDFLPGYTGPQLPGLDVTAHGLTTAVGGRGPNALGLYDTSSSTRPEALIMRNWLSSIKRLLGSKTQRPLPLRTLADRPAVRN
jgi:hypothetical protein